MIRMIETKPMLRRLQRQVISQIQKCALNTSWHWPGVGFHLNYPTCTMRKSSFNLLDFCAQNYGCEAKEERVT